MLLARVLLVCLLQAKDFNRALLFENATMPTPGARSLDREIRLSPAAKTAVVDLHNTLRGKVDPQSVTTMQVITYDMNLQKVAQDHAKKCEIVVNNGRDGAYAAAIGAALAPGTTVGENLAVWRNSRAELEAIDVAINQWYRLYDFYDHCTCECGRGSACEAYTQIAWADTVSVGCGMALCNDVLQFENAQFIVCNYYPGILPNTQPYLARGESSGRVCGVMCDDSAPTVATGDSDDNEGSDSVGFETPSATTAAAALVTIIAILAVLAIAFILLWHYNEKFRTGVHDVADRVKSLFPDNVSPVKKPTEADETEKQNDETQPGADETQDWSEAEPAPQGDADGTAEQVDDTDKAAEKNSTPPVDQEEVAVGWFY